MTIYEAPFRDLQIEVVNFSCCAAWLSFEFKMQFSKNECVINEYHILMPGFGTDLITKWSPNEAY